MIKRALARYDDLPQTVKATIWFSICSILQRGIQFFTVPILTRIMPTAEYGEYSVFLSWYQVISVFATLNMWEFVLNNGLLKYEDDQGGYLSSLQGLSTLITIALFVVYLPFSETWERATSMTVGAVAVMFVELLFRPSYEYWRGRERFKYKYKGVIIFTLSITLAVPLVSIPLVLLSEDKGMAAIIGRTIPSAAIYAIAAVLIAKQGRKFFDKAYWKFALRFNLPLLPHFLSSVILQQADRIMISSMAGDDKAGIYSLAYSAARVMGLFGDAIMASYTPYVYRAIRDNNTAGVKRIANYLAVFVAGLNLALICVAPEAVRLLGPRDYWDAMYVIPPVAISGLATFLPCLFACVEYYYEETRVVSYISVGCAALNIVLNALFIPRFGYLAAGYTTLVCYVVYCFGHYAAMRAVVKKYMNGKGIYDDKTILLIAIVSLALAFSLLALYDHPIIRYALVLTAGIVCITKRKWIMEQFNEIRRKKA